MNDGGADDDSCHCGDLSSMILAFWFACDSTRLDPFSAVNNDDQIHSGRTDRARSLRGGLLPPSLLFSLAFGRCDLPSEAATAMAS